MPRLTPADFEAITEHVIDLVRTYDYLDSQADNAPRSEQDMWRDKAFEARDEISQYLSHLVNGVDL